MHYLVAADAVPPFLQYALGLLLDPDKKLSARLRRCGLPECRRYFLTPPKKRPRIFCSDAHRDMVHDREARVRVAASRAGMSAKEYRRRYT
jgi:hypothetical protein